MAKQNEIRLKRQDFAFVVIAIFMTGAILGISMLPKPALKATADVMEYSVEMGIPAIDAKGAGVVGTLFTTVKPGTGRILVNVDNVLSQIDTQFSSRTAVAAAANYMKTDASSIDVIFNLRVNATTVEGPSAGSAMAASVVLALRGISPDGSIMMTGTIEDDGSVGNVGAIQEKALAAKDAGAEIFIIPKGQSTKTSSRKNRSCETIGQFRICNIRYVPESVNFSSSFGITVVEAGTLGEIMEFYETK